MSNPQTDKRAEQDPLLDFSTEGAGAATPEPPVRSSQLIAPPPVPDALDELRRRLDHLNAEIERTSQQINALRSEVATLVSPRKNIPGVTKSDRGLRLVSAIAGVALGIISSAWFWMSTSAKPLVDEPGASIVAAPPSETPAQLAAAQLPAAPAPEAPQVRERALTEPLPPKSPPPRSPQRRAGYVGTLTIDSDPPGDVIIDGKPAGKTPVRAEDLRAGSHLVWIQRDGYRRFTRVVQVQANRVSRLTADLERAAP